MKKLNMPFDEKEVKKGENPAPGQDISTRQK